MKKWKIAARAKRGKGTATAAEIVQMLLKNRGLVTKQKIDKYLSPPDPYTFTASQVGINPDALAKGISRIERAVRDKESIVVYSDYDADGITACAILWERLHRLGARVMPHVPHRLEEGYGFTKIGLDKVKSTYVPTLIISVDHGITAYQQVAYAKSLGMDVVVSDHHVKPKKLPDCTIIHTTDLCGAGIAWFIAKELGRKMQQVSQEEANDMLALAAIGTIADMVPLQGVNRSLVKFGLAAINSTRRIGLNALIEEVGLTKGNLTTYEVSYMLVPRLNAMGRLVHALDALRLLLTKRKERAQEMAAKLGVTNRERQVMTEENLMHAKDIIEKGHINKTKKILIVHDETYNQGVIGLVAGKLVEAYYRPAIVVSVGPEISKASARSVNGFNIIEYIRSCADLLVDAGGHPMAAGFTVETARLAVLKKRLENLAEDKLKDSMLTRVLKIDLGLHPQEATEELWEKTRKFEPFGMLNQEPVFALFDLRLKEMRPVGREGKHIKMKLEGDGHQFDAIGFGLGDYYGKLVSGQVVDVAFTLTVDTWNGRQKFELKVKDIRRH